MNTLSYIIYEQIEIGELVAVEKSLTKKLRKIEEVECYPLVFDEEQKSMKIDFENKVFVETKYLKIAK